MSDNDPEKKPSSGSAPGPSEGSAPGSPRDPADRDLPSHAADDPTAMWDEGALREAGMEEVANRAKSMPPPAATGPAVGGDSRRSVVVGTGGDAAGPESADRTPRPRRRPSQPDAGLSWPITIALAIALGVAVYFLVRLIR